MPKTTTPTLEALLANRDELLKVQEEAIQKTERKFRKLQTEEMPSAEIEALKKILKTHQGSISKDDAEQINAAEEALENSKKALKGLEVSYEVQKQIIINEILSEDEWLKTKARKLHGTLDDLNKITSKKEGLAGRLKDYLGAGRPAFSVQDLKSDAALLEALVSEDSGVRKARDLLESQILPLKEVEILEAIKSLDSAENQTFRGGMKELLGGHKTLRSSSVYLDTEEGKRSNHSELKKNILNYLERFSGARTRMNADEGFAIIQDTIVNHSLEAVDLDVAKFTPFNKLQQGNEELYLYNFETTLNALGNTKQEALEYLEYLEAYRSNENKTWDELYDEREDFDNPLIRKVLEALEVKAYIGKTTIDVAYNNLCDEINNVEPFQAQDSKKDALLQLASLDPKRYEDPQRGYDYLISKAKDAFLLEGKSVQVDHHALLSGYQANSQCSKEDREVITSLTNVKPNIVNAFDDLAKEFGAKAPAVNVSQSDYENALDALEKVGGSVSNGIKVIQSKANGKGHKDLKSYSSATDISKRVLQNEKNIRSALDALATLGGRNPDEGLQNLRKMAFIIDPSSVKLDEIHIPELEKAREQFRTVEAGVRENLLQNGAEAKAPVYTDEAIENELKYNKYYQNLIQESNKLHEVAERQKAEYATLEKDVSSCAMEDQEYKGLDSHLQIAKTEVESKQEDFICSVSQTLRTLGVDCSTDPELTNAKSNVEQELIRLESIFKQQDLNLKKEKNIQELAFQYKEEENNPTRQDQIEKKMLELIEVDVPDSNGSIKMLAKKAAKEVFPAGKEDNTTFDFRKAEDAFLTSIAADVKRDAKKENLGAVLRSVLGERPNDAKNGMGKFKAYLDVFIEELNKGPDGEVSAEFRSYLERGGENSKSFYQDVFVETYFKQCSEQEKADLLNDEAKAVDPKTLKGLFQQTANDNGFLNEKKAERGAVNPGASSAPSATAKEQAQKKIAQAFRGNKLKTQTLTSDKNPTSNKTSTSSNANSQKSAVKVGTDDDFIGNNTLNSQGSAFSPGRGSVDYEVNSLNDFTPELQGSQDSINHRNLRPINYERNISRNSTEEMIANLAAGKSIAAFNAQIKVAESLALAREAGIFHSGYTVGADGSIAMNGAQNSVAVAQDNGVNVIPPVNPTISAAPQARDNSDAVPAVNKEMVVQNKKPEVDLFDGSEPLNPSKDGTKHVSSGKGLGKRSVNDEELQQYLGDQGDYAVKRSDCHNMLISDIRGDRDAIEKSHRTAFITEAGLPIITYSNYDDYADDLLAASQPDKFTSKKTLNSTGAEISKSMAIVEIKNGKEVGHRLVLSTAQGTTEHKLNEVQFQELQSLAHQKYRGFCDDGYDTKEAMAKVKNECMPEIADIFSMKDKASSKINKEERKSLLTQCKNDFWLPGVLGVGRKDRIKACVADLEVPSIVNASGEVIAGSAMKRDGKNPMRVTVAINGDNNDDIYIPLGAECYVKVDGETGKPEPDTIFKHSEDGYEPISVKGDFFTWNKFSKLGKALYDEDNPEQSAANLENVKQNFKDLELIVAVDKLDGKTRDVNFMVDEKTHGMQLSRREKIAFATVAATAATAATLGAAGPVAGAGLVVAVGGGGFFSGVAASIAATAAVVGAAVLSVATFLTRPGAGDKAKEKPGKSTGVDYRDSESGEIVDGAIRTVRDMNKAADRGDVSGVYKAALHGGSKRVFRAGSDIGRAATTGTAGDKLSTTVASAVAFPAEVVVNTLAAGATTVGAIALGAKAFGNKLLGTSPIGRETPEGKKRLEGETLAAIGKGKTGGGRVV